MKIQFLGAAREVTGSQYYVCGDGAKVLVDCGMFQEREFLYRNWEACPVRPRDIDVVLLTHAHIDHCGLLPRLVQEGFRGPIFATGASADLAELVLRDSAQIQAEDIGFKKKRHRKEGRKGKFPEKPLYTMRDVQRTLPLLKPVAYGRPQQINGNISAVFHDAGHILGSAMIELTAEESGQSRRLLFSGDIGQQSKPLLRPPTPCRANRFPRHGIDLRRPEPRGPPRHRGAVGRGDRRNDRRRRQGRHSDLRHRAGAGVGLLPGAAAPREADSQRSRLFGQPDGGRRDRNLPPPSRLFRRGTRAARSTPASRC